VTAGESPMRLPLSADHRHRPGLGRISGFGSLLRDAAHARNDVGVHHSNEGE
jgi:hypothetical protein